MLAAALAALAACAHDGPLQPGVGRAPGGPAAVLNPACDYTLGGQVHGEFTIDTPTTWTRANNPHLVYQSPVVTSAGRLTLEPGVVVCFFGTQIVMQDGGTLVANGLDRAHRAHLVRPCRWLVGSLVPWNRPVVQLAPERRSRPRQRGDGRRPG
ncbi:MAG TPA: hypothetical protein VFJ82_08420, partial [Longimicrobium sp.]|nr:hypothetical protein [Longimicrobium sp.]